MLSFDEKTTKILAAAEARQKELEKINEGASAPRPTVSETSETDTAGLDRATIRARFAALSAEEEQVEFHFTPPKSDRSRDDNSLAPVPAPRKTSGSSTDRSSKAVDFFAPKSYVTPKKEDPTTGSAIIFNRNVPHVISSVKKEEKLTTDTVTIEHNNTATSTSTSTASSTRFGMQTFLSQKKPYLPNSTPDHQNPNESIITGSPMVFKGQRVLNLQHHDSFTFPSHGAAEFKPLSTSSPIRDDMSTPPLPPSITATTEPVKPKELFRTVWSGASKMTPVPEEPSRKDSANLQNLRSRWELASSTGTPLHPDASEEELRKLAALSSEKTLPATKTTATKLPHVLRLPHPNFGAGGSAERTVSSTRSWKSDALRSPLGLKSPPPVTSPHLRYRSFKPDVLETSVKESEVFEECDFDSTFRSHRDEAERVCSLEETNKQSHEGEERRRAARKLSFPSPVKGPTTSTSSKLSPVKTATSTTSRSPPTSADPETNLAHSISFYRKNQESNADDKVERIVFAGAATQARPQLPLLTITEERTDLINRLERDLNVADEHIHQAQRALECCREMPKFAGSPEEVDAQRALLTAQEKKSALMCELNRVDNSSHIDGPRGGISLSNISFPLSREFINGLTAYGNDIDLVYHFIVIIKCGATVLHTNVVSSEDAMYSNGIVAFPNCFTIKNLRPDFLCTVEVFALRSRKEACGPEEKYRSKGGTFKGLHTSYNKSRSPGRRSASRTASLRTVEAGFESVGSLQINIKTVERSKYRLENVNHPVQGDLTMRVKKYAIDKCDVVHRGFLSLHQTSQGLAAWSRYWCVLEGGEMKFWRNPEEENSKNCRCVIDLSTCSGEGAVPEPHGTYPSSFHINVWVPKEGTSREMEILRVLMAADHKEMMTAWITLLNRAIKDLLMWNSQSR